MKRFKIYHTFGIWKPNEWKKSSTKWKTKKTMRVFAFQNYGKFWSVSLEHFIKHKRLISEEYACSVDPHFTFKWPISVTNYFLFEKTLESEMNIKIWIWVGNKKLGTHFLNAVVIGHLVRENMSQHFFNQILGTATRSRLVFLKPEISEVNIKI